MTGRQVSGQIAKTYDGPAKKHSSQNLQNTFGKQKRGGSQRQTKRLNAQTDRVKMYRRTDSNTQADILTLHAGFALLS